MVCNYRHCVKVNESVSITKLYPLIPIASHISSDNSSTECLAQAKRWIQDCSTAHTTCAAAQPVKLPKRVIAVGSPTVKPRLYEPSPYEKGHYAALSYCWGKCPALKTTHRTYASHLAGFELEEMPKTLRDAVHVARELGIPYVWIDSLCIIQDSNSDWEHESGQMCSVFTLALVTFAALDSPGSNNGLFISHPERCFKTFSIVDYGCDGKWKSSGEVDASESVIGNVYVRHAWYNPDPFHGPRHVDRSPDTTENILFTRAWTFQEIKLSPRLLWFTAWEIGWRCDSLRTCECSSNTTVTKGRRLKDSVDFSVLKGPLTHSVTSIERAKSYYLRKWMHLLNVYTAKDLSFETDRLPAISGLAGQLHPLIGSTYLGGLWGKDIAYQLLWYQSAKAGKISDKSLEARKTSPRQETLPEDYAPSWSWASVFGQVQYGDFIDRHDMKLSWDILGAKFTPNAENIYGPGKGSIEVKGLLVPLKMGSNHVEYCGAHPQNTNTSPIIFGRTRFFYQDHRYLHHGWSSQAIVKLSFIVSGYIRDPNDRSEQEPQTLIGLILESTHNRDEFRRVGLGHTRLKTRNSFRNYDSPWPWEKWESCCERRTITIV